MLFSRLLGDSKKQGVVWFYFEFVSLKVLQLYFLLEFFEEMWSFDFEFKGFFFSIVIGSL